MLERKQIEERLAYLIEQRQVLIDQTNACCGAIQENETWLKVLDKTAAEALKAVEPLPPPADPPA